MLCDILHIWWLTQYTVNNFAALFNRMPADRALDIMKAPAFKLSIEFVGARYSLSLVGSNVGFLLLQRFIVGVAVENSS